MAEGFLVRVSRFTGCRLQVLIGKLLKTFAILAQIGARNEGLVASE